MKYKIGEVAKFLGITPEAIRFYESRGVIAPDKDDSSGYRLYDVWDLHMLIRARSYRQFGYSLAETARMLNQYGTPDFMDSLTAQEEVVERNILWNINLLRRLRQTEEIILDAGQSFGTFSIRTRPAVYRLETQSAYTINPDAAVRERLKKWVDKVPFVYPCALFAYADVVSADRSGTFTFGLGADAEYGEFLGLKDMEGVLYFPPLTAVYTTIKSDSNEILTTRRLLPAMEYMQKNGLTLCGDVLSRVVLMRKEGDVYVSYHQLWLPFETV